MTRNPLVRIRHRTILRQGLVPRSALQYLDGWREVEDKPSRRKTTAAKKAAESTKADDGQVPEKE